MIKSISAYYRRLKKREKTLVVTFLSVAVAGMSYQAIYKPLADNLRASLFQLEKLETRLEEARIASPKVDKKRANVRELKSDSDRLLREIEKLENKLPSRRATSNLISELTRLAKGMKLNSIRQKIAKGKEYPRLFVELKFDAPYKEAVNYIKEIEAISPFLKVEEMEISATSARLVISSLLGETPFSEQLKAKETSYDKIFEFRDVFASEAMPISAAPKAKVKLEGITYSNDISTSIINGRVVKEGSVIGGLTVKRILPDMVALTDGIKEYLLSIER
ncbi:MAG: type 4a pilus biogenesis protein PilO [Candidatus Omnitrophota bacterium]|nr:MAG: type 4a pilus biogenesis protein PilO [Candidatus Omnitrophota bacterium]